MELKQIRYMLKWHYEDKNYESLYSLARRLADELIGIDRFSPCPENYNIQTLQPNGSWLNMKTGTKASGTKAYCVGYADAISSYTDVTARVVIGDFVVWPESLDASELLG